MRIGIDCRGIDSSSWYRGIGEVYRATLYSLAENLRKNPQHDIKMVLVGPSIDISFLPKEFQTIFTIEPRPICYDVLHVIDPMSIQTGIDSWLYASYYVPNITATFYDAIPELFNNSYKSWPDQIAQTYWLRLHEYLPSAKKVFAISEEARRQYAEVNPLSYNCVVVPIGADRFEELDDQETAEPEISKIVDSILSADFPYLLTVGGADPHKCLALVREAFFCAKPVCPNLKWIHVGKNNGYHEQLHLESVPGIVTTGQATRGQLNALMQHERCIGLASPSYIEGLGLPAREALACNKPVLICDISAYSDLQMVKLTRDVATWTEAIKMLFRQQRGQKIELKDGGFCADIQLPRWSEYADRLLTAWQGLV